MLKPAEVKKLLDGADSYRGTCPSCGGRNTLSISQVAGELLWSCYKASCGVKGREASYRTVQQILAGFGVKDDFFGDIEFKVPAHFTSAASSEEAMRHFDYLFACTILPQVRYDPKQDRAVYLIQRNGRYVDAIGRKLSGTGPKWYRYGNSGLSFMLNGSGRDETCVVVEDIPSACVIGSSYSSVALLGTSLSDVDVLDLKGFKYVVFCLDPDAYSKSVIMADRMSAFTNSYAVRIPNDLKYYSVAEAKEIVDEHA